MALSEAPASGRWAWLVGFGRAAGFGFGAGLFSATVAARVSSPPPLTRVKPTKPITATIAATMAAVQLGRRGSGRMRSASKSGAAGVGAGRPPCSASYCATSGSGSSPTARASVRMCPRA